MGTELNIDKDEYGDRVNAILEKLKNITLNTGDKGVLAQLQAIAEKPDAPADKKKSYFDKKKPMNLGELTKSFNETQERMEQKRFGFANIKSPKEIEEEEEEKSKRQTNTKENEKETQKRQAPEKSADDKKKELAQTCKLPDGLEIEERAGRYKLINKSVTPPIEADVTDLFAAIANYNYTVEQENKAAAEYNETASSPKGLLSHDDKVGNVSDSLKNVKTDKGEAIFSDEYAAAKSPEAQVDLRKALAEYLVSSAEIDMEKIMNEQLKESAKKEEDEREGKKGKEGNEGKDSKPNLAMITDYSR